MLLKHVELVVLCLMSACENDIGIFQYSILSLSTVIVVGYIHTNVTVSESTGVVQLTIAISMPPRGVSIETSFYLIVNTLNGTATG